MIGKTMELVQFRVWEGDGAPPVGYALRRECFEGVAASDTGGLGAAADADATRRAHVHGALVDARALGDDFVLRAREARARARRSSEESRRCVRSARDGGAGANGERKSASETRATTRRAAIKRSLHVLIKKDLPSARILFHESWKLEKRTELSRIDPGSSRLCERRDT